MYKNGLDPSACATPVGMLVFGDSIANGLGVRENRYSVTVADRLGLDLVDFSRSGTTVIDSLALIGDVPAHSVVAIIAHGVTEPIYRPTPNSLRYLPRRWRRRGWMDPRPYFSRRITRRALEKLESAVRWRVKVALMTILGSRHQLTSKAEYVQAVTRLVYELRQLGIVPIVLGPPSIDDRFFPGSSAAQSEYAEELESNGIDVIRVSSRLHKWDDYFLDHFHPNESGHRRIASLIEPEIRSALDSRICEKGEH